MFRILGPCRRCVLNTDQNKDGKGGSHLEETEGTASGDPEVGMGV